jgi:glycosyltransferase involved in cell wall biosynthesis
MPGLFIRRQAEAVAAFCDVAVLCLHPDEHILNRLEIDISHEGNVHTVTVYYRVAIKDRAILKDPGNLFRFFRACYFGFKVLREFRPDLVHVHVLTRMGLVALLYKMITGRPYLVTEHWSRYLRGNDSYRGLVRKDITQHVVSRSMAMIAVSGALKEAMLRHGLAHPDFHVVPNPVDMDRFRIREEYPRGQGDRKQLLHVSCFDDRSKNISGLLRVIQRLSVKRKDFICHLAGTGPDWDRMKELAYDLGILDEFVTFNGLLDEEALVKAMNEADFLVLSSHYETFASVIIESLACGTPVVATRTGIVPEVVVPLTGITVEPGDEDELEAAVGKMLDDCRNYDRLKIRESVLHGFSMDEVGKQLEAIYDRILNYRI